MKKGLWILTFIILFTSGIVLAVNVATVDKTHKYQWETAAITGGEITDGRDLRNIRWGRHPEFERIVLDIYQGAYEEKGPAVSVPCYFQINYEYYPFRFTGTLMGIRARNAEFKEFPQSDLIQGIYSIPYLDDSGIKFAIALEQPVEYEIFELHDPGRIVIDMRAFTFHDPLPEVYSLRTGTGLGFEEMGQLKEELINLDSKNPRIIRAGNGNLFVEEGFYTNEDEARQRLEDLSLKLPEVLFFIELRKASDIPE